MAKVRPFRGLRPPKNMVTEVASRPYDVLNSEEARKEAGDNEKSLYHIIRPEIDFAPGTDEHDPKVYEKAVIVSPATTSMRRLWTAVLNMVLWWLPMWLTILRDA